MYNIDELYNMDPAERIALAESLGMKKAASADVEQVVYHIIDHSAISAAKEQASKESKRAPKERKQRGRPRKQENEPAAAQPSVAPQPAANPEDNTPKKRGRKPKKQVEAEQAAQQAGQNVAQSQAPTSAQDAQGGASAAQAPAGATPKKRGRKSKAQLALEAAERNAAMGLEAPNAPADTAEVKEEQLLPKIFNYNHPAILQPTQSGEKRESEGGMNHDANLPAVIEPAAEVAATPASSQPEQPKRLFTPSSKQEGADAQGAERQNTSQQKNAQQRPQTQRNTGSFDSFFGKGKGRTFTPRAQRDQAEAPVATPAENAVVVEAPQPVDVNAPEVVDSSVVEVVSAVDAPANPAVGMDSIESLIIEEKPLSKRQQRIQQRQLLQQQRREERALLKQQRQLQRQQQQQQQQQQLPAFNFEGILTVYGCLEIVPEGHGYLRSSDYNYLPSPDDIYVSQSQIKEYGLRNGDVVEAAIRPPRDNEKHLIAVAIKSVNGLHPSKVRDRVPFEHLTPLFPEEKFVLTKGNHANISTRVVDMFAPIGKGQRALIVAPPKTGKTILLKDIANAISENHPETYIIMLLIDERPEEVTDMARSVNAEVIASTFDEPAERHVKIAGIVLEKAKRLVECGHDVVIMLDSITRLARAYNTVSPASGKILSGGVDANALQRPKRFFGAARNIEGGGSLTIIATALTETSSKMDEVIFEEFKGTGNMELQLDRKLSNKRIFPAVDIIASSTRRDDLLISPEVANRMWVLRNYLADMNSVEAMEFIKKRMEMTRTNEELLVTMDK